MIKTVVITGSTRGIGFHLTVEFLKRGHQVIINGTSKDSVNKALTRLNELGFSAQGFAGHVADHDFPELLFRFTNKKYGKVDIWINNAGIAQSTKKAWNLEPGEVQHLLSVNLIGLINCTSVVYRLMAEQGHGKIFNMEGLGSDGRIIDKQALYGTSKRAVGYFTRAFAKECMEGPVQVGILSPGMVVTDFILKPMEKNTPEDRKRTQNIFNLLGDKPETVAAVLVPQLLNSQQNYDRIEYLTKWRMIRKLLSAIFKKNDYFRAFNEEIRSNS